MKKSYKAYRNSNYFNRDNYPDEPVTTEEIREEKMTDRNGKEKEKLVAYFHGYDQGLVLNDTRCQVFEKITGSENPADWRGVTIKIFFDPSIKFGSETKGGMGIRPATKTRKKAHRPVKSQEAKSDDEEEIPY